MKRLAVVLFGVALTVAAQIPDSQTSGGLVNGRFWNEMPRESKTYFVVGFGDALIAATKVSDSYFSGATVGEMVKGLDQFYADPANAAIPVAFAMPLFAQKVEGATAEELGARIAALRRLVATPAAPAK